MGKNTILKTLLMGSIALCSLNAQGEVDAIEAARQAKAAAEKAAATAAAATDAAIEAAAAKAAKDARADAKQAKQDKVARAAAEAAAAEEAELDATAAAAAKAAKRKMAAELGIEIEDDETVPEDALDETNLTVVEETTEDVVAKEDLGWNIGGAASVGLLSGATFTSVPVGATFVLSTPYGFKLGALDYNISIAFGGYTGKYDTSKDDDYNEEPQWIDEFNPTLIGFGGNLTIAKFIFAEGHVGIVGEGTGFRGFAGITLERLMKKGLNLPFNLLIGSEAFISNDMAGAGNTSGWASLGVRLDYGF
jgi:hypothetical protein